MLITIDTDEIEKMVREAWKAGANVGVRDPHISIGEYLKQSKEYAAKVVRRLLAKQPAPTLSCGPCTDDRHSECVGPGCACFEAGDVPREFILHPIKIAHAGGTKEPT